MLTAFASKRDARAGSALVGALVVLLGLLALSAGMLQVVQRSSRERSASFDDEKARYLAEAAVAEGIAALRAGSSGNIGSEAAPARAGDGVLWVEATDLGSESTRFRATALAGSGRAALDVVVRIEGPPEPLFFATLNSKDTLTMNEGVVTDSFDSELGTYASQVSGTTNGYSHAELEGDVASNADIILNARATVLGDATPGPLGTVTFNTDSYVHGSTAPAPKPSGFPEIDVPPIAPAGPLAVPGSATLTLAPGDHGFDSVSIGKGATLLIEGPATIVTSSFSGIKDANLMIDATGGPVTIYCETYSHDNGFEVDAVEGSPAAVAFFVSGTQDIVFPSNSKIRGAYYAPDADILFASGNEAWGSFAANKITMSNSMRFHYDEALSKHWDADGSVTKGAEVLSWTLAPVPEHLSKNRRDPFVLLDLDMQALPSAAASWIP